MGNYTGMRPEQGLDTRDIMIKEIVFDTRYLKLPGGLNSGDEVILLEVLNAKFEDLHPSFLCVDSASFTDKKYEFPKTGDALVLLLLYKTEMFTTIRNHTPVKEFEYRQSRGSTIKVIIKNEEQFRAGLPDVW